MRRGREVTSLPAGGLTSGSRGAGWICHQPLEQGERSCSFPLRKTDVLPPPARRIPLWITSSRAPPEDHLRWVLKPFHGWNSTNHPCSPLAVDGAAGGTGYPPKQTHSRGPARLQQLWRDRGNVKHSELGFDWALSAPLWGWAGAPQVQPSIRAWHSMWEMLPSLLCRIAHRKLTQSEFQRFPWVFLGKELQQEYLGGVFSVSHTFTSRACSVYWVLLEIFVLAHLLAVAAPQVISVAGVCFVAVFSNTEAQALRAGRVAHALWADRKIYFYAPGV